MAESQIKQEEGESSHFIDKDDELKKEEEELKNEEERLKKKRDELERKKQQKIKQSEQNDPIACTLDTGIKKEKSDGVLTDTKQGSVKKMSADQRRAVRIHSKDALKFEKRGGIISDVGIKYEVKMVTLIFLKLINLGYKFYLCSNLNGAGDFDDVVVKYTKEDGTTESVFIQLKHAEKDNTKRSLSFVQEKHFFDLHKYFTSVCNSHIFKDPEHVIFNSDPSTVKYLIITNADVDRFILSDISKVGSFIDDIVQQGDILKINDLQDYDEFCYMIEMIKGMNERDSSAGISEMNRHMKDTLKSKHKRWKSIVEIFCKTEHSKEDIKIMNNCRHVNVNRFRQFISNTVICCKQINVNGLDAVIKDEIAKTASTSSYETETVFAKLLEKMTDWRKTETYYLTENCNLWYDIMRETEADKFKKREKELMSYGLRFKDEIVKQLRDDIQCKCGVVNIVCHGERTDITTLKVWQALNLNEQQDYIFVSVKECLENDQLIFRTWPNWWCKTLVIECKEDCLLSDKIMLELQTELQSKENSKLILISSKTNCFNYPQYYEKIIDDTTLDQLDNESQKKLVTKMIKFQGFNVPLSSILEKEHLENLSSNALSHLITDDKFKLGENFDSFKILGYIKRHIEIPYVSKIVLDNNEKDTMPVIELEHEQPALLRRPLKSSERFILHNGVFHLTKRNKAGEFRMLCEETEQSTDGAEADRLYTDDRYTRTKQMLEEIETIRKYMYSSKVHSVDEQKFITSDLESPVIITGEPGIGKTSLLKQMSVALKKQFPTKWVVFIDLSQYCEFLYKLEVVQKNHIIEMVKMSLKLCNVSQEFFYTAVKDLKNFIILLDAFDEISPDYTTKVKEIVKFLVEYSFFVCITSRPSTVLELSQHLAAVPYTVKNLNEKEAKQLFNSLINTEHLNKPEQKLTSFTEEVLSKAMNSTELTLTTNPLHVAMLAEIYNDSVDGKFIKTLNILQVYTEFIEKKCKSYYKKWVANTFNPNAKSDLQQFVNKFFYYHKLIAAQQIFPDEIVKRYKDNVFFDEAEKRVGSVISKIGISDTVSKNNITFIHRSFTEYFSALWLAEYCSTCSDTLREVIHNKEMEMVRKFYDLKCAENSTLHTAAIVCSEEETLTSLIQNERGFICTDTIGRTALHLAATYNNVKAVELLVKVIPGMYCSDNMLYSPLDYAVVNHSFESINILLSTPLVSINHKAQIYEKLHNMENEIIYICCAKGLQHFLKLFLQNMNVNNALQISRITDLKIPEISHFKFSKIYSQQFVSTAFPLLVAVEYNQYQLVRFLVKKGCDIWVRDSRGNTALHIASSYGYTELVRYFIELSTCNRNNTLKYQDAKLHSMTELTDISKQDISRYKHTSTKTKNGLFVPSTICVTGNMNSKCIHEIDLGNGSENPLLIAAKHGHFKIVKCLVENNFDVNYADFHGNTTLQYGSKTGHIDIVKFCVENGCNVDLADQHGMTASLYASKNKNFDIVKYLLEKGCSISHADKTGMTVLLYASMFSNFEIVKFCVEKGCNIDHADEHGMTASLYASKNKNFNIVKYLLEKGCSISHADKTGMTVLLYASMFGNFEIVKFCVDKGCNIDHADEHGMTASLYASKNKKFDIVKYLIEKDCNISHADINGMTVLLYASMFGNFEIVKFCVEKGCNIDHADEHGMTASLYASKNKNFNIVKYLLEKGCSISHADKTGMTVLLYASMFGNFEIVKSCVEKGCNIDHANKHSTTASLYASYYKHFHIVKYLLENGCNINYAHKTGMTALLDACIKNQFDIVKFCVENGCNIDHADQHGMTASLYASRYKNFDIVKYLLEKNCSISHAAKTGMTVLLYASKKNQFDIVKFCVENGCNIHHADQHDMTASLYASEYKHFDIVKYLIEKDCNISHADINGMTVLLYASMFGNFEIVKICVEKGCNIDHADQHDMTASLYASEYKHFDIVKYLIEKDCNISHADINGMTVLLYASMFGNFEIVKSCVEKGCNIDHADQHDMTASLYASRYKNFDIVKYLIEKDCNISHADINGMTVLLYASMFGNFEIVKSCVEKGCNINHADQHDMTASLYASEYKHFDIVKYLIEKDCNISHADDNGMTVLLYASMFGNFEIVKFCVEKGCNIDHADQHDMTASLYASEYKHFDIVKYLIEKGCNMNYA